MDAAGWLFVEVVIPLSLLVGWFAASVYETA